ncbi:complement C4-A-like [Heterodontus francisci]|uniref:complement C4-A-like n=1 Tax=Heterodontus francisci TaxID=7792 RepID=UPI00355BF71F
MLLLLLCFCAVTSVTEQAPSFMITAPNIIHIGVKESVSIQLHDAEGTVNFQVYCWDIIKRKKCSETVLFTLNPGNKYHDIKTITVSQLQVKELLLWRRRKKYVYLVAESRQLLEQRRMVPIKLSSKRGYIFIQTDQPIYTPNQTVKYRIFTLDHFMRPVNEQLRVSIYNSRNMELMRADWMSQKMKILRTKIPDNEEPGIWRIEAQFLDSPMSKVSAQFEVKEFVLPRFDVKVQADEMFYLVTKDEFRFKIVAKHTYGEAVAGKAFVRFGILHGHGNKTYIGGLEQELTMLNGEVNSSVNTENLLQKSNLLSRNELVGLRLYMAVTTVELVSGEMEELELSNIKFVSSPYVIDLSKTTRHFIPKSPFATVATVTYPDGTPAVNVPVNIEGGQTLNTDQHGLVVFERGAPANANILNMKVTAGNGELGKEFHEGTVTAQLYQSPSKSYLHIRAPHSVLKTGQDLNIEFTAIAETGSESVDYYYYILVSKGRVITADRIRKADPTMLHLPVVVDMVPTFRLLAYYYIHIGGRKEIVANAVWIDVEDHCDGQIEIKDYNTTHRPGSVFDLQFSTNDAAKVSFVVVDSAVYILNNKNKLTARKVFEAMNSYDLGCFYGGGANSVGVFMDAGLSFISDVDTALIRHEYSCKNQVRRQRRALNLQRQYAGKLDEYPYGRLRKCCMDGLTKILMLYSCEERARRVRELECRLVFQTCCDYGVELRKNQSLKVDSIARSAVHVEEEFFDETDIHVRSLFPPSWLWETFEVLSAGDHTIRNYIPDSITTWEIQAVGMFANKGFCVAEPKKMKVFRPFFISMKLPYSVKRNEQLDVRVIIYNYLPEDLEVSIYMREAEGLCSPATSRENKRNVLVKANSAASIQFAIVPLIIGNVPINVIAYSETNMYSDAVLKHLRVLAEGVVVTKESSIPINPKEKAMYEIQDDLPTNMVPETDNYLYIRPTGTIMGEAVENSLSAAGINKLIKVPTGCAEQTAMHLAPTVFAVEYLDRSDQWISLKAERKDEAIFHIQTGYNRILGYKKDDGSYGAWKTHPSSTWLTAFIVKILSMARSQIIVNDRFIHQSVAHLIRSQTSSGAFEDPHPVLMRDMQGGVGGSESNVSITAFVTIALQHSLAAFRTNNIAEISKVDKSIQNAVKFLSEELPNIKQPHTIAITAYALAFVEADSSKVQEAGRKLKAIASYDRDHDVRYWKADETWLYSGQQNSDEAPQAPAITVETTSYALLQALLIEDIDYATPIVKWLTEQQNYGGGFRSTQDTVIALEALSQYHIAFLKREEEVNMQIQFNVFGRASGPKIHLRRSNALSQKELKFPLGSKIRIELTGQGNGTLNLRRMYHLMEDPSSSCENVHLSIKVKGKMEFQKPYDYTEADELFDDDMTLQADSPIGPIGWYDLRSRRKREVPDSEDRQTIYYEVCYWRDAGGVKDQIPSGMAIVDISLLSGLEPELVQLDQLKNGVDQYIDHYDYKDGRVLLYLDTVCEKKECIMFATKQITPMGLVQPTTATLYDFYNPSIRCTVSYSAPERNAMILKLCDNEVCTCAEGPCPRIKHILSGEVNGSARSDFACYSPIVDYAYTVRVMNQTTAGYFDNYHVSITSILKMSSKDDEVKVNDIQHFLQRKSCQFQLKEGKDYLLMGKDGTTSDGRGKMQYLFDAKSWIEAIPSEETCGLRKYRSSCKNQKDFMDDLVNLGCQM